MANEPQWGKGGNDGPPDLDELWRRFNQRLSGMFGGKGGKGGSGNASSGGSGLGIGLIVGVVFLLWVASGFYIVDAGERGVVTRFGRFVETTQPGPRWHIPYPIEAVKVVNIDQVRTVEVGYRGTVKNKVPDESLMLTDDENIIDLQFAVQYTLKDPEDYVFNNRSPDDAVMQVAETAIREIVGKNKMDYVLYEGRADIAAQATHLMQRILDRYKTGISISKVTMQNAQPPEQVQAAFDDAVKAGQDRERLKNEGQAYANDVVPRAKGMAARLLQEADGYRQRVIDTAEGDASRFSQILAEYNKAPAVTRERMYLDTMQQILSSTTKVMVDQKSGGSNLLYLPLDKLMEKNAAEARGNVTPAAPAPASKAADNAGTSADDSVRGSLRMLDREDRP